MATGGWMQRGGVLGLLHRQETAEADQVVIDTEAEETRAAVETQMVRE
jgi:hypothetical protein